MGNTKEVKQRINSQLKLYKKHDIIRWKKTFTKNSTIQIMKNKIKSVQHIHLCALSETHHEPYFMNYL